MNTDRDEEERFNAEGAEVRAQRAQRKATAGRRWSWLRGKLRSSEQRPYRTIGTRGGSEENYCGGTAESNIEKTNSKDARLKNRRPLQCQNQFHDEGLARHRRQKFNDDCSGWRS